MKDSGAVPNRATGSFEDDTAKKLAAKKKAKRNANKQQNNINPKKLCID